MEITKEYKVNLDSDWQGVSIGIIESIILDGEVFTKPMKRRAFRKVIKTEEGEVENPNYYAEIDAWTGETNFIQTKVNF